MGVPPADPDHPWMTTAEVAAAFRVDPKTANRWAVGGRFKPGDAIKLPGGGWRVRRAHVNDLLNPQTSEAPPAATDEASSNPTPHEEI